MPTREGEVVQKFEDIYNIPTPVVGMSVFVRETEKSYIVKSLKKENVGGKEVYTKVDEVVCMEEEIEAIKTENVGRDAEISANKVKVNALTNSLNSEVTRAQEAEAALNDLINGEGSNAKYSTRFIGVFSNFSDLLAELNSLVYNDSQKDKNLGSFRALLAQRIVEIKNVSLVRNGYSLVQVVSGPFEETNGSLSLSSTEYGIFSRIHDNTWSQWKRLTTTMGEVNTAISNAIAELIDKAPENLDTLKEIADWIKEHGKEAADMLTAIQQNTIKINASIKDVDVAPGVDDVELDLEDNTDKVTHVVFPAATTETAGVMSAEDKKNITLATPIIQNLTKDSLSKGYIDGGSSTYNPPVSTTVIYHAVVSVTEGTSCTLTTVRRNLGYMYMIYNANDERIEYFAGNNDKVITKEFVIPEGGVKLAVNCDANYLDSFSLSTTKETILSKVIANEERISSNEERIVANEKQVTSVEQGVYNYDSSALSNGYIDGSVNTYTKVSTTSIKCLTLEVEEGMKCTLTSVRRNNGYMYLVYNVNDEKIAAFTGHNDKVITEEFTIPKGGVKLAVNCDSGYLNSFALNVVGIPTLLSRVMTLEAEVVDVEELSARNKVVWTLGSSTIDLMRTTVGDANGVKEWEYLSQLLSAKKLYNIAIGGSTWQYSGADTSFPTASIENTRSASNQILMMKRLVDELGYESPDIIFLQFTNGYSTSGTITDNMDEVMSLSYEELEASVAVRYTFYGGVRYAFELLYRLFPNATYFVSDGIQCDRDLPYRRGYEYVKSGREALEKMCDRYSIPFIPTSKYIGIVDLYEHGSKTSTSKVEVLSSPSNSGTVELVLGSNVISVQVTAGESTATIASRIASAVTVENNGWSASVSGSTVNLSVAKENGAVPTFNANSTGLRIEIAFNQFANDYDGRYLGTDGLHPNEAGKKLIARSFANSIMNNYFKKP